MGKRKLVVLLSLSSWCLLIVEWLFLTVPLDYHQFVIVVFPDHTHLLLFKCLVASAAVRSGAVILLLLSYYLLFLSLNEGFFILLL